MQLFLPLPSPLPHLIISHYRFSLLSFTLHIASIWKGRILPEALNSLCSNLTFPAVSLGPCQWTATGKDSNWFCLGYVWFFEPITLGVELSAMLAHGCACFFFFIVSVHSIWYFCAKAYLNH